MHHASAPIHFNGGPFDGHCQIVSLTPEQCCRVIALPVNHNILRLVGGQPVSALLPVRVAALYARDQDRVEHYDFLGYCRPEEVQMDITAF